MNVNAAEFSFAFATPTVAQEETFQSRSSKNRARRAARHDYAVAHDKYQSLFKTELCKSYCENGYCRYGNLCTFAHGTQELTIETAVKKKDKNCKTFFATGYCPYGVRCQFQHEHRHINQIKRYPNVVRLITYESLFSTSVN